MRVTGVRIRTHLKCGRSSWMCLCSIGGVRSRFSCRFGAPRVAAKVDSDDFGQGWASLKVWSFNQGREAFSPFGMSVLSFIIQYCSFS